MHQLWCVTGQEHTTVSYQEPRANRPLYIHNLPTNRDISSCTQSGMPATLLDATTSAELKDAYGNFTTGVVNRHPNNTTYSSS